MKLRSQNESVMNVIGTRQSGFKADPLQQDLYDLYTILAC